MGQYRQWLHYQELDRSLRKTVESLAAELAQLESQLDNVFLEQLTQQADPLVANPIVSALLTHEEASVNGRVPAANEPSSLPQASEHTPDPPNDALSPALLYWGGLPDFGPRELEQPGTELASPFTNYPAIELLPDDQFAFLDEHTRTDPQLELPWWLRKITIADADAESARPIDQESIRTNRLVQRWVERWGRQTSTAPEGESEATPDAP